MIIPALLYFALKKRMKKEAGWKKYLVIAAGVFVVLVIITKM
jgi:hypothetical protein